MKKYFLFLVLLFYFCLCNVFSTERNNNKNEPVEITAKQISIDKNKNILNAKGNVNIVRKNIYKITTNTVEYDRDKKIINIKDRVKILDSNGNKIFADGGTVSDNLDKGELKDAGIILNNGTSIFSPKIINNDGNIFEAKGANYCFCKNDNIDLTRPYTEIKKDAIGIKSQALTLYAKKSKLDNKKERIYFYNVVFKMFQIPFMYVPYFFTSSKLGNRVDGFTKPDISFNTNYGTKMSIGYRWFFGDNADFLLKPTLYTKWNFMINTTFNYKNDDSLITLNDYYAFDNNNSKNFTNIYGIKEEEEKTFKNNRYYINLKLNHKFSQTFYTIIDFNLINDNYMLRDYLNDNSSYKNSNFFVSKIFDNNSYINVNTIYVKRILHENNVYNPEVILNTEFYKSFIIDINDSSNAIIRMNYFLNNLFDKEKIMYDKLTLNHNFQYNSFTDLGFVEFNADIYSDIYTNKFNKNEDIVKDKTRIIPEISIKYQKDFVLTDNFTIKPLIEYYYSQDFNRNLIFYDTDTIDSYFSINNIFSNNRYSGNDLVEFGNRINYGLNILYDTYDDVIITLTVAQGYREKINKNYRIINFEDTISNIVSGLNIQLNDNFSIDYMTVVDKNNFKFKSNEFLAIYTNIKWDIIFGYFMNKNELKNEIENSTNTEQVNLQLQYKILETLTLFSKFEYDIQRETDKDLYTEFGLTFKKNCITSKISIKKDNYVQYNGKNKWDINFSFNLDGF